MAMVYVKLTLLTPITLITTASHLSGQFSVLSISFSIVISSVGQIESLQLGILKFFLWKGDQMAQVVLCAWYPSCIEKNKYLQAFSPSCLVIVALLWSVSSSKVKVSITFFLFNIGPIFSQDILHCTTWIIGQFFIQISVQEKPVSKSKRHQYVSCR